MQAYAASVGPFLSPIYKLIADLTFTTPAKGARGPAFAAASPVPRAEPNAYRAAYLKPPGVIAKANPLGESEELRRELWKTTDEFLKGLGLALPSA